MRVFVVPEAAATIRSLSPETKRRIKRAILALPEDPVGERSTTDVKMLVGHVEEGPIYRLRVGTWRVVFRIARSRIEVVRVFPRAEGYGWMERLGF